MIIEHAMTKCFGNERWVHNAGNFFDGAAACTLFVLGLLAVYGMITWLSMSAAYLCLGAGIVYAAIMLIRNPVMFSCRVST